MNLLEFESIERWVGALSAFFADRLWRNPQLRICLPSGQTPTPLYAALARAEKEGQISFQRVTIFCLDEFGGLDPSDPGRCVQMLRRDLIDRIELPEKQFHQLDPDAADLNLICRAYDEAIGAGFDLCLLGLGPNGHLGMNEPGSLPESRTRRVDLAEETIASSRRYLTHSQLPRWGVTVGLGAILKSREVWLLATGPAKAEIVRRTLREPVEAAIPSTFLRQHPHCSVFLDAPAAALLDRPRK